MIERDGWVQVRMRGSHRQFTHPVKPGTVTVSGKAGVVRVIAKSDIDQRNAAAA